VGFPKNEERERILLEYWKQGINNRITAQKTGIPEGTVNRYNARFNKHPETFARTTNYVAKARTSLSEELLEQAEKLSDIDRVKARHKELMDRGKFFQAKLAIEADRELENYISSRGKIGEYAPLYHDTKKNIVLLPQLVKNQMEELERAGQLKIEDLDKLKNMVDVLAIPSLIRDNISAEIVSFKFTLGNKRDHSLI